MKLFGKEIEKVNKTMDEVEKLVKDGQTVIEKINEDYDDTIVEMNNMVRDGRKVFRKANALLNIGFWTLLLGPIGTVGSSVYEYGKFKKDGNDFKTKKNNK